MASPNPAFRGLAPELVFCTDAFQEFVAEHKKTEFNDNMAELAKFGSFCKKALESKGSLPDQCSFFESVYDQNAKLIIYCWNMLKEFTREYNEPKFMDHLAASRAFVWFATWNNALDTFLKEFDDNRGHYEALSGRVEEFCGRLLKLESIMHQTSSRTKSRESVEHKAKREVKKFRKPDRSGSSTDDEPNDALFNEPKDPLYQKPTVLDVKSRLSRRLVDLAGIRILVYFPDDVSKVIEAIKKSDAFDIEYAVLSFTRNRKDARGEDMDKQKQGTADINYLDGPWYSPPISPEEAARRWRHSGYRAVHLCVKSKGPLETEIIYDDSPRQSWRRKVTGESIGYIGVKTY
jgi:ppGpp synthetase/RelA/SpoT-type nucleotidyltranferase